MIEEEEKYDDFLESQKEENSIQTDKIHLEKEY